MNAAISAFIWCGVQVTVLTFAVTFVYLAARRVHPRAGAAAAGGGLLMVLALTLMVASPWPRWELADSGNLNGEQPRTVAIPSDTPPSNENQNQTSAISDRRERIVREELSRIIDGASRTFAIVEAKRTVAMD